jgi:hypothetical protein
MQAEGLVGSGGFAIPLQFCSRHFAHCGSAATPLQKFGTGLPFFAMSQMSPQPLCDNRFVQAHC